MRQKTITFILEAATPVEVQIHISLRCCLDCIWVLVTEDETCAPGVILRYDPTEAAGRAHFFEGELPSPECTVLLGMRDHPLTNVLASTLAYAIQKHGDNRSLLLCLSVLQTAKRMQYPEERKKFVSLVKDSVLSLSQSAEV